MTPLRITWIHVYPDQVSTAKELGNSSANVWYTHSARLPRESGATFGAASMRINSHEYAGAKAFIPR